jgi:formate hydrogenlyase subunit 3/multisubunit Na+/H+ antiporter MnhD subunit
MDPILLIAVPLGGAFLLPLIGKLGRAPLTAAQLLLIGFTAALSLGWLPGLLSGALQAANVVTGGYDAPIGINLHFGLAEAVLSLLASLTALGSTWYLHAREDAETLGRSALLQVLVMTAAFGLIMTRDLFNLFVFLEIAAIGTYALVAFDDAESSLEAGFKYAMVGAAASAFLLIAIAFLYKLTGTLNIDDMAGKLPAVAGAGIGTILLFLLMGMAIELKLLPVNGPGLDLYDGASPGVMALLVGTTVNGVLFAFWKLGLLFPQTWSVIIMSLGMVTFFGANLLATVQDRPRRMLGYSSSAQVGLLVFLVPLIQQGVVPLAAAGLLVINHTLAKAGLLWLTGNVDGESQDNWVAAFENNVIARTALIVLILAITGLPPFPGFWGKWQVLASLTTGGYAWWIAPVLAGSLFEFVYYYGWYRRVQTASDTAAQKPLRFGPDLLGPVAFAVLTIAYGLYAMAELPGVREPALVLLAGVGLALTVMRRLPRDLLSVIAAMTVAAAGWLLYGAGALRPDTASGLFLVMILGATLLVSIARLRVVDNVRRERFMGMHLLLTAALVLLVRTDSLLLFFVAWEVMTWTSYLIISQGRLAPKPGQLYMAFSGGAGFLVLGGLMLAIGAGVDTISGLAQLTGATAAIAWALLALGFLVKSAAWGVHIWAPGAYAESPDLFTPFLSGVVSKIPMFGLALVAFRVAAEQIPVLLGVIDLTWVLAAIGAATAFGMTLAGVFQEDAKKLLAYSSVGQVGYIVVGLAILSPLGWAAAFFHAFHHLLFKALLFFAVAAVVMRTGTRTMYEMGGLIKKMPVSFMGVLIGIIALSGVPPLPGFAGKWLLYQALLEKGWLFILTLMMFATVVAFIYMYRLIHSIFLGQLKTVHRDVKEGPLGLSIVQAVLMLAIVGLGFFPQVLLDPLNAIVAAQFGAPALAIDGTVMTTAGGQVLNGTAVMLLTMVMFATMALVLLVFQPTTRKVRQLDIGYSAEMPPPPEEAHFAARFTQPYERAWSFFLAPRATRFWIALTENFQGVIDLLRKTYTGNGQTYVLYPVLLIAIFTLLGIGLPG